MRLVESVRSTKVGEPKAEALNEGRRELSEEFKGGLRQLSPNSVRLVCFVGYSSPNRQPLNVCFARIIFRDK